VKRGASQGCGVVAARRYSGSNILAPTALFAAVFAVVLVVAEVGAAPPASAGRLTVRLVTGAEPLAAGSEVELRVYEVGGRMRRFALAHGEAWSRDSTHVISVDLAEALDPRSVTRYAVYYRGFPNLPAWEIASAEVDTAGDGAAPVRLLDATLAGAIAGQGELSTEERSAGSLVCVTDADCDDHRSCNGIERCAPQAAGSDARGCVKGAPVVCPVNQICSEGRGCRGPDSIGKSPR
jgi:hypothetical protein